MDKIIMKYNNGDIYEGNWTNNKKNGKTIPTEVLFAKAIPKIKPENKNRFEINNKIVNVKKKTVKAL
jgi:hypothetical protein